MHEVEEEGWSGIEETYIWCIGIWNAMDKNVIL
jgi:hypothetical protein